MVLPDQLQYLQAQVGQTYPSMATQVACRPDCIANAMIVVVMATSQGMMGVHKGGLRKDTRLCYYITLQLITYPGQGAGISSAMAFMVFILTRNKRFSIHCALYALLCGYLLPGFIASAQAETRILASIKPLALIAQEVAGTDIPVDTLLPVTASPHDYPLKMSDHRRLHQAALVLWVGAELESFLDKPLRNLPPNRSISTYDLPGIQWPDDIVEGSNHHGHSEDPHLWLNPQNAVVIAKALAVRLGQFHPEQAQLFAARAESFAQAMQILDNKLRVEMEPLKTQGFAVYHEGYAHFVAHYGLHQLGYVTYTPERRPGAKHTHQLRRILDAEGVCLFTEPFQKTEHLQELAKELDLRLGQLNPIGDNQVKSYKELLEGMGQAFSACLAHR